MNPLFWRLHGWVDDCIDDWFEAQEASSPGRIKKRKLHGVDWFEVNKPWVLVDKPFVGVSIEHHGGHHQETAEIETMLKVMAAIENDDEQRVKLADEAGEARPPRIRMRFQMPDVSMRFEMPEDGR